MAQKGSFWPTFSFFEKGLPSGLENTGFFLPLKGFRLGTGSWRRTDLTPANWAIANEWDQLRGHAPNNGPGTNTVEYTIETDDLSAFGVSLVMKYAF